MDYSQIKQRSFIMPKNKDIATKVAEKIMDDALWGDDIQRSTKHAANIIRETYAERDKAAIELSLAVDELTDLYAGATLDEVRKANERFKKELG